MFIYKDEIVEEEEKIIFEIKSAATYLKNCIEICSKSLTETVNKKTSEKIKAICKGIDSF